MIRTLRSIMARRSMVDYQDLSLLRHYLGVGCISSMSNEYCVSLVTSEEWY